MSARFAAQIMLIRHGEKPPDAPPPHGVSAHGERNTESLTVRGWQRAGALASLFAPATGNDARHGLSVPRHLYACNPHLPTLAHHIVGDHTIIPHIWSEDRCDLVWVFDLDPATGNYVFREVGQELLDEDL